MSLFVWVYLKLVGLPTQTAPHATGPPQGIWWRPCRPFTQSAHRRGQDPPAPPSGPAGAVAPEAVAPGAVVGPGSVGRTRGLRPARRAASVRTASSCALTERSSSPAHASYTSYSSCGMRSRNCFRCRAMGSRSGISCRLSVQSADVHDRAGGVVAGDDHHQVRREGRPVSYTHLTLPT